MEAKLKDVCGNDGAEEVHHPAPSNGIPGPPNSSPDPKTVDIIKYYKQARIDHDFKLIEVKR